jgi:lipoprotein-releasing system permease protein
MNRIVPFLGIRYLLSKRRGGFISLITWISIGGVTLGVGVMIVVMGIMTGMQDELRDKILAMTAHMVILKGGSHMDNYREVMKKVEKFLPGEIVMTSPFIYNQGLIATTSAVMGVVVRGIDPEREGLTTRLGEFLKMGDIRSLLDKGERGIPRIILGSELMNQLGVTVGNEVNLVTPGGTWSHIGVLPKMRRYEIGGIFRSGMYEYDLNLVYISLSEAQKFFGLQDQVTGIQVRLKDPDKSHIFASLLETYLGFPYYAKDWKEMNRNLFSALQLEKIGMGIILVLIILVAAFNIVSTLFMVVLQKGREIAILKAMGTPSSVIYRIFLFSGVLIGFVGATAGCILGVGTSLLLKKYPIIQLPKDVYYIDHLPIQLDPLQIAIAILSALIIATLATLYPARRAARLDPVEGIRYSGM